MGKIFAERTKIIVTLLPDEDAHGFWLGIIDHTLATVARRRSKPSLETFTEAREFV